MKPDYWLVWDWKGNLVGVCQSEEDAKHIMHELPFAGMNEITTGNWDKSPTDSDPPKLSSKK